MGARDAKCFRNNHTVDLYRICAFRPIVNTHSGDRERRQSLEYSEGLCR